MIKKLNLTLLVLAMMVVGLGAYTRLKDAGLGCPDWPFCYGHVLYPQSQKAIAIADEAYPERPFELNKAWPEVYHRYLAGTLGLGIMLFSYYLLRHQYKKTGWGLLSILGIQATLGAWTVTWLLHPHVVLLHLLGGFAITTLLFCHYMGQQTFQPDRMMILTLAILIMQIILGGWTSVNYAALVCPDFPTCQGILFPPLQLGKVFFTSLPIGDMYEYGVFDHPVRVSIHMLHRYMALLLVFSMGYTLFHHFSKLPTRVSSIPLGLLCLQLALGIANIKLLLPISIAVSHNLTALCLLLSWIWYIQQSSQLKATA